MASITRDSSPPEAPRCSGSDGAPGWASSRSSTSSAPSGPTPASTPLTGRLGSARPAGRGSTATSIRACGMASPASSTVTCSAKRTAASRRDGGDPAGQLGHLAGQPVSLAVQLVEQLVGGVQVGQPGAGPLGPGDHAVDVVGVLAGQRAQRGPPLVDRLQPGRVGVQRRQVRRQLRGDVGRPGWPPPPAGRPARRAPGRCRPAPPGCAGRCRAARWRRASRRRPPRRRRRTAGPAARRCAAPRRARAAAPRPSARRPRRAAGRPG